MKHPPGTIIETLSYPVYLDYNLWRETENFLLPFSGSGGLYLLADTNTLKFCLPLLTKNVPLLEDIPVFSIPAGEQSKDPENLIRVWDWLLNNGANVNSLLINLGGGVVSDLGGFAAATYNRGIRYINIPTSLIAQADASIGGKTAINISGIKNQAGIFYDPAAVFINTVFLETLPVPHFKSGFAEIIKCAALSGERFWDILKKELGQGNEQIFRLIFETVNFKCQLVAEDPFDKGRRKMLNFGHTVGHALESIFARTGNEHLLHGQAVAMGMICEASLSNKISGLGQDEMEEIISIINSHFILKPVNESQFDRIAKFVSYDKKKAGNAVGYSLLDGIGKHSPGKVVNYPDLMSALRYYNDKIQAR